MNVLSYNENDNDYHHNKITHLLNPPPTSVCFPSPPNSLCFRHPLSLMAHLSLSLCVCAFVLSLSLLFCVSLCLCLFVSVSASGALWPIVTLFSIQAHQGSREPKLLPPLSRLSRHCSLLSFCLLLHHQQWHLGHSVAMGHCPPSYRRGRGVARACVYVWGGGCTCQALVHAHVDVYLTVSNPFPEKFLLASAHTTTTINFHIPPGICHGDWRL